MGTNLYKCQPIFNAVITRMLNQRYSLVVVTYSIINLNKLKAKRKFSHYNKILRVCKVYLHSWEFHFSCSEALVLSHWRDKHLNYTIYVHSQYNSLHVLRIILLGGWTLFIFNCITLLNWKCESFVKLPTDECYVLYITYAHAK